MILPWKRYADFSGRSTRREFWLFRLSFWGMIVIVALLGSMIRGGIGALLVVAFLAFIVPSIATTVRRLHDQNRSGWWYFASYIPFIGWIVWLVLMFTPGTQGENDYGADPRQPSMDHLHAVFE